MCFQFLDVSCEHGIRFGAFQEHKLGTRLIFLLMKEHPSMVHNSLSFLLPGKPEMSTSEILFLGGKGQPAIRIGGGVQPAMEGHWDGMTH